MKQLNTTHPIGGYFELELPRLTVYHPEAIALNSGRFCLEYILRCRKYKKVYVPYFTCDSAVEPIEKLGIAYEFYHIDNDYHIAREIRLGDNEALMYTNYWGMHDDYCRMLAGKYHQQLILDYTQAFFSRPTKGVDTFYSCRKFFGVPDGGYLYTDARADLNLEQDESYTRMESLLKRIDLSPEAGYDDFQKTSQEFHHLPIRAMSKLTSRMMQSIDYGFVARQRLKNYNFLRTHLGGREIGEGEVPMVFPFESKQGWELRNKLIADKIFVAKYWPNVARWAGDKALETWMTDHIIPLPIDQRYGEEDMARIIEIIKS